MTEEEKQLVVGSIWKEIHECSCGCLLSIARLRCKRCEEESKTTSKMREEIESRNVIDTMVKYAKPALNAVEAFMKKHGREPNRIAMPMEAGSWWLRRPLRMLGIKVVWMDVESPVALLMGTEA